MSFCVACRCTVKVLVTMWPWETPPSHGTGPTRSAQDSCLDHSSTSRTEMSLTFTPPATGTCKEYLYYHQQLVRGHLLYVAYFDGKKHTQVYFAHFSHILLAEKVMWPCRIICVAMVVSCYGCHSLRVVEHCVGLTLYQTLVCEVEITVTCLPYTQQWTHNNECVHNDCVLCIFGQGSLTSWHYSQS